MIVDKKCNASVPSKIPLSFLNMHLSYRILFLIQKIMHCVVEFKSQMSVHYNILPVEKDIQLFIFM